MSQRSYVLLFAGQGAQTVGMGKDLAEQYSLARRRFAEADEFLGYPLSEVMFYGPAEELTRTSRCQSALYVHGLVCLEILRERWPEFTAAGAAGLSLGEFTAHAAAGTFDFITGLDIVAKRGRYMEEATNGTGGAMAAMIGGADDKVAELAADCDVDVANYNAPGQIVISGTRDGVERAVGLAKEYGIRMARMLDVAGAYHSRLMMPAQEKLAGDLVDLAIGEPEVPVVCNVDASLVSTREEILSSLERQVSGSVRWCDSVRKFIADGDTRFLEIGPGGVLSGLMRRIDSSASISAIHDGESIEALVEEMSSAEVPA